VKGSLPRLLVVLGLVGLAGAGLYLVPPVREPRSPAVLYALPAAVGAWTSIEGVPETTLPVDPKEVGSVRRTFQRGKQTAWVTVALYGRQDDPRRRASLNHLYVERRSGRVDRLELPVALNGTPDTRIALSGRLVTHGPERILVAYWYQVGRRPLGNESGFRLALMRSILLSRQADSALVRIAVPLREGERPEAAALPVLVELAPALHASVNRALDP
jgi:EpsI family protein